MKAKNLLFSAALLIALGVNGQTDNLFVVTNAVPVTTGDNNTLVGTGVGTALSTGSKNTFIGSTAGAAASNNEANTYLGFNARGTVGLNESGAIGADAEVTADRTLILGRANDPTSTLPNVHVGIGATIAPAKLTVFNGPNPAVLSVPALGMEETYDCITANFTFALSDVATASINTASNASNVGSVSLSLDASDYNAGVVSMGSGGSLFNVGVFGNGSGADAARNWGIWGDAIVDDGLLNIGVAGIADDQCGGSVGAGTRINYGVYGQCDPLNTGPATTNNFAGFFSGNVHATGAITQGSDIKLKENIAKLTSSLDKIKQVSFYSYNFRRNEFPQMNLSPGKHYGVIAQELEKVFPELVINTKFQEVKRGDKTYGEEEFKAVNYIELIPITMQAVQELDAKVEVLNKLLRDKGVDVAVLADAVKGAGNTSGAYLEQNAPNPFNSETVIKYYVPETASKVMLVVMNIDGEVMMKETSLQTGKQEFKIKAGELKSGTYFYTLFSDNEIVATKKMIMLN